MGALDKVVAAVTPEPSEEDRAEARAQARRLSGGSGWLAAVIDHHEQVEAAFAEVKAAGTANARRDAQKKLATLLTGHSIAEEAALYPAMALHDQKGHSSAAYTEQSAAKVQTAALDDIAPMTQDYLDKLEHLRAAVIHHVYEEESEWFPKLRKTGDAAFQAKLTKQYAEQFTRYMGAE
ncbi:MAG: hemerythrin domain-containing protein [Pseudomonadota bacterium]|nr:hemerythrin domain-containing protein [Pseudomonadota bacterium]